jgi:hypothetical protein
MRSSFPEGRNGGKLGEVLEFQESQPRGAHDISEVPRVSVAIHVSATLTRTFGG